MSYFDDNAAPSPATSGEDTPLFNANKFGDDNDLFGTEPAPATESGTQQEVGTPAREETPLRTTEPPVAATSAPVAEPQAQEPAVEPADAEIPKHFHNDPAWKRIQEKRKDAERVATEERAAREGLEARLREIEAQLGQTNAEREQAENQASWNNRLQEIQADYESRYSMLSDEEIAGLAQVQLEKEQADAWRFQQEQQQERQQQEQQSAQERQNQEAAYKKVMEGLTSHLSGKSASLPVLQASALVGDEPLTMQSLISALVSDAYVIHTAFPDEKAGEFNANAHADMLADYLNTIVENTVQARLSQYQESKAGDTRRVPAPVSGVGGSAPPQGGRLDTPTIMQRMGQLF